MGIPYVASFGHSLTNRAYIFYGKSGDHYLSIEHEHEKSWFWCLFQKTYFWHENGCGRPTLLAPKGLGLQNPTKKLAHWSDPLGQPLSRNHGFKIFRPESLNLRSIFTFLLFLIELKRSYRELFSGWKNVVTSQSY